jgi:DNA (cytosine-5)-methyltransferase 1
MAAAYYSEWDPYAADWLRNLIAAGHLPPGDVDERSIVDVRPDDLRGYTQCHFFAGIGGWAYAARLAGWPDDEPLWTGSCPCQPFSVAGKGLGAADERHLWPAWFGLIRECRPAIIFGEQVAAAIAKGWLDGVFINLESIDYAGAAAVLPAIGVGAPHQRDRIVFVAHDAEWRRSGERSEVAAASAEGASRGHGSGGAMADTSRDGIRIESGRLGGAHGTGARVDSDNQQGDVAFAEHRGREGRDTQGCRPGAALSSGEGFWRNAEWLTGADRKARRVKPGVRLLANGVSGRVAVRRPVQQGDAEVQEEHWYNRIGALKGFGNAIVPQLAAEFIAAYREARLFI